MRAPLLATNLGLNTQFDLLICNGAGQAEPDPVPVRGARVVYSAYFLWARDSAEHLSWGGSAPLNQERWPARAARQRVGFPLQIFD